MMQIGNLRTGRTRTGKRLGIAALALAAGGCGIVSPLYDRSMSDAPNAACVDVDQASSAGERPQCFALLEENEAGARTSWSGGALTPGRTLVAVHKGAMDGCKGRFTHLTVTGGSDSAGKLTLHTWDAIGRMGHHREATWGSGFASRTLGLASIDHALMAPAGARIRVTEGNFNPVTLCFKSY